MLRGSIRRRASSFGGLVPLLAAVVLSGCIGATSRDDFEQALLERGNGFAGPPPVVALDLVLDELQVADVDVASVSVWVADGGTVIDVRDPRVTENLDRYRVERGELVAVEPVQVSSGTDLDRETFPASSLPLDRYDELLATAVREFGAEGAEARAMSISWTGDGPLIRVLIESPRASGAVRFDANGRVLAVER